MVEVRRKMRQVPGGMTATVLPCYALTFVLSSCGPSAQRATSSMSLMVCFNAGCGPVGGWTLSLVMVESNSCLSLHLPRHPVIASKNFPTQTARHLSHFLNVLRRH